MAAQPTLAAELPDSGLTAGGGWGPGGAAKSGVLRRAIGPRTGLDQSHEIRMYGDPLCYEALTSANQRSGPGGAVRGAIAHVVSDLAHVTIIHKMSCFSDRTGDIS